MNLQNIKNQAERKFAQLCINRKYKLIRATREQDIHEHWDFKIINPKTKKSSLVDVKGAKKINRSDSKLDYNIAWLEFQNVRGEKGSLKGKADFIAFEQKNHFLIVKRIHLLDWAESKVIKLFTTQSKKEKYRYYQRPDRKDIITLVNIADIKKDLKHWEILDK
jgi:hypothetical protein